MTRVVRNERGIALAVAIFALVVVGALVAGAFFAGTQEQRVGENVRRVQQAFGVAEGGAFEVVRTWTPESINSRRTYPQDPAKDVPWATAPGGTGSFSGSIFKLNPNLYLVDVTGADSVGRAGLARSGGGRQRVGVLLRIRPLQIETRASLTTRGTVRLAGNAFVDGTMHSPPGWTNCDTLADTAKAGIRTPDSSLVQGEETHATGSPPMTQDPTVTDSTFTKFGDVTYNDLAARANVTLPGGNYQTQPSTDVSGACNKNDPMNWGDGLNHAGVCGQYFPIIHITGSVTLNGVQGQGILLVDGDLNIQGSYEFFGVTIIRGSLRTAGGGTSIAHFWGTVMAANVDLDQQSLTGNATLNYSKCAIIQSLQYTGLTALMRSRSWAQLF